MSANYTPVRVLVKTGILAAILIAFAACSKVPEIPEHIRIQNKSEFKLPHDKPENHENSYCVEKSFGVNLCDALTDGNSPERKQTDIE